MIEAHLAAKTTCACALFESSSDLCRALVMINSLQGQHKSGGMICYISLHLISTLFMRRSRITPFTYSAAAFGSRCIKIVFKQVSTMVRTRPQLSLLTVSMPCFLNQYSQTVIQICFTFAIHLIELVRIRPKESSISLLVHQQIRIVNLSRNFKMSRKTINS